MVLVFHRFSLGYRASDLTLSPSLSTSKDKYKLEVTAQGVFVAMNYDEIKTVTVSLLGESFTLRCHKSQADSLQRAVGKIQEITARILRDNPSLTPQQAAIIAAIESQSQLQRYLDTSTPFQEQAMQLIHRIKRNLNNLDS